MDKKHTIEYTRIVRTYTDTELLNVLFLMIANNPQSFFDAIREINVGEGYLFTVRVLPQSGFADAYEYDITGVTLKALQVAVDSSGKVSAIKVFREVTRSGLYEAKIAVEGMFQTGKLVPSLQYPTESQNLAGRFELYDKTLPTVGK
jgi:hypothetical protein